MFCLCCTAAGSFFLPWLTFAGVSAGYSLIPAVAVAFFCNVAAGSGLPQMRVRVGMWVGLLLEGYLRGRSRFCKCKLQQHLASEAGPPPSAPRLTPPPPGHPGSGPASCFAAALLLQAWINGVDVPGAVAPLTLLVKAGGVMWAIACGLVVGKVCCMAEQGRGGARLLWDDGTWWSAAALPCSYACRPHDVLRHLLFILVLPQEGPFIHSGGILGYLVGMGGSQLVQRCAREWWHWNTALHQRHTAQVWQLGLLRVEAATLH